MTVVLKNRISYVQSTDFSEERFCKFIDQIVVDSGKAFPDEEITVMKHKLIATVRLRKEIKAEALFDLIIRESNDRISQYFPQYTFLSAAALLRKLYKDTAKLRGYDYHQGYGDFYNFVTSSVLNGIYDESLTTAYTKEELVAAGKMIDKEKDRLLNYPAVFLLKKNILAKNYNGEVIELPQERFMTIALYLMRDEKKDKRMEYVKEAYWALSNLYIGAATPTLTNSGRPMGTLSSCHILTMDDSLKDIFRVVSQSGDFSQNGAGLGVYLGFLRAYGSWIRGYKGRAEGVLGPAKLLNEVANYVNQLGVRKGAIALYLPIWHADIFDFLELRLKTGSQERRAHSIFTAVCIPDEFMRRLEAREKWTIVDPYEVKNKLDIDLNRLYDKKLLQDGEEPNAEDHAFTYYYRIAEKADLELKRVVNVTEIYKSIYEAQKTGGTPYIYYSDTVARLNPNPHAGIPLSSNLCTEIMQNQSPSEQLASILSDNGVITEQRKGDGLVTCNLNSLVLSRIFADGLDAGLGILPRVVSIQMRMLDNVISLDRTVVHEATHTNRQYRAVGAGAMGLATLLADLGVRWESERSAEVTGQIFEAYEMARIRASNALAVEKGTYPLYKGSDWDTGAYFEKRGLDSPEWLEIKDLVMNHGGVRNGYMAAVAPTGQNSMVTGCSPSLDAMYEVIYQDEKSGMNVTIIPNNYSAKTKWFYKSAFEMDEKWSMKIIAAAQKYIDQGISHNLHLHKDIKASEYLDLHMYAWKIGLKTLYYNYMDLNAVSRKENCISCES